VACGEFAALARSYAEAFRTVVPNDPAAVLGQVWVESKAGEWQRCIAFADQLPATAGGDKTANGRDAERSHRQTPGVAAAAECASLDAAG
jgi:hypothetical protein